MAKASSGAKSGGGKTPSANPAGAKSSGAKPGGGRVGPLAFLRQVRQEASRVTWPSRKETWIASLMVFIMVAVTAVFFFVADQALAFVVRLLLGLGG